MDGLELELRTCLQKTNLFILKSIGSRFPKSCFNHQLNASPRSARTERRGFGAAETNREAPTHWNCGFLGALKPWHDDQTNGQGFGNHVGCIQIDVFCPVEKFWKPQFPAALRQVFFPGAEAQNLGRLLEGALG